MNNVTKMELYKVLSKPQVYIIFVVGLIIQSIMAGQMRTTMFNGYHKSVYENYMNETNSKKILFSICSIHLYGSVFC